jgi:23S rRNA (pseudouridine1915-N3)-methyltransferase
LKITVIQVGKTTDDFIIAGVNNYEKRLQHYISYKVITIPAIKSTQKLNANKQKEQEGELILNQLEAADYCILLDEKGKEFSSENFANYIANMQLKSIKNLVFVIGGPFGFDKKVYDRANDKMALSLMTFSHQMIRLLFTEQLYRAYTIIKGESYHHV